MKLRMRGVRSSGMSRDFVAAGIGVASTLALFTTHELVGHGLATVLLGAHLVHFTSVDSSYAGPATKMVMRLIAAAGIASNIVIGLLAVSLLRRVRVASAEPRFALWFFGHATLFMGTSYLGGFALFAFGDVHGVIGGLAFEPVIRVVLVVAGIIGYRAAYLDAAATGTFAMRDVLVAYVAGGLAAVASASLNPAGSLSGALWGAAATFGAGYGLVGAGSGRTGVALQPSLRDARTWPALGGASLLVLLIVLGPGVPR